MRRTPDRTEIYLGKATLFLWGLINPIYPHVGFPTHFGDHDRAP